MHNDPVLVMNLEELPRRIFYFPFPVALIPVPELNLGELPRGDSIFKIPVPVMILGELPSLPFQFPFPASGFYSSPSGELGELPSWRLYF